MNCTMTRFLAAAALLGFAANADALTIIGDGPGGVGVATSGNGNFEAGGLPPGAGSYTATPNWHNLNEDTPNEPGNFTQTGGTQGSPESGGRAAFQFSNGSNPGFFAANDTGYVVQAAGETFDISFWASKHGNAGQWADPFPPATDIEKWRFSLLTVDVPGPLNVQTKRSETTELGAVEFVVPESDVPGETFPDENWRSYASTGWYTTTAADVGKTVYLGMEFLNESGPLVFPRVDIVQLDVNQIPEPTAAALAGLFGIGLLASRKTRR